MEQQFGSPTRRVTSAGLVVRLCYALAHTIPSAVAAIPNLEPGGRGVCADMCPASGAGIRIAFGEHTNKSPVVGRFARSVTELMMSVAVWRHCGNGYGR